MNQVSTIALEAIRDDTIAFIRKRFDDEIAAAAGQSDSKPVQYKMPTPEDGRHPDNKIGHNLTARGVEILYRMFDVGAGYNRASKMLNITQAAAKNRKATWTKAGGLSRTKLRLPIDD